MGPLIEKVTGSQDLESRDATPSATVRVALLSLLVAVIYRSPGWEGVGADGVSGIKAGSRIPSCQDITPNPRHRVFSTRLDEC